MARGGDQNIIKMLLAAGADCRAIISERDKITPLQNVMSRGYYRHPNIFLLMDARAANNPMQNTQSMIAWAIHHDILDFAKRLIEDSPDPQMPAFLAKRPLLEAARPGHEETLKYLLTKLLLEHNAHADAADHNGGTSLMHAALYNKAEVTAMILKRTTQPHALHCGKRAAVTYAMEGQYEDTVDLLFKHGLSPTWIDPSSTKHILFAVRQGSASYKAFSITPQGNHIIVEILLKAGANLHTQAHRGSKDYQHPRTPLGLACAQGNPNVANIHYKSEPSQKLLGIAGTEGHTDTVQLLLAHGAEVNSIISNPRQHRTALINASEHGHLRTVELVLAHGACVSHADYYGRTALSPRSANTPKSSVSFWLPARRSIAPTVGAKHLCSGPCSTAAPKLRRLWF
ncbi:ankyrin repeat-containing domain protein [Aspergillus lucknowensis]|uniref:Ankyrin repeat-containing domain protein n=1 Tax=Aspergillus lucknowensis TaxID=176173 RepID=A0ABR4LW36_9EURO